MFLPLVDMYWVTRGVIKHEEPRGDHSGSL